MGNKNCRQPVKAGIGIGERNEGNDGNAVNQSENAGNQGGNAGNQGGNAGNEDGNVENQGDSLLESLCLLLRLKCRTAKGASHQPAFMGSCLTISQIW